MNFTYFGFYSFDLFYLIDTSFILLLNFLMIFAKFANTPMIPMNFMN